MVQNDHGSCRIIVSGASTPGVQNPSSTLVCQFSMLQAAGLLRMACFAHVADAVNAVAAARQDSLMNKASGQTKLVESDIKSARPGNCSESDMGRSLKAGTVEFRGKEHRRIKLELKTKQGTGYECTSEIRISEPDGASGSTVVDKVFASIEVENIRKSSSSFRDSTSFCTGLKSVGISRFGLWSGLTPTKVVFKWLPIEPEAVSAKLRHRGGEFVLQNESAGSARVTPVKQPSKSKQPSDSGKNHAREELKNFICGGFAGVVSRTAVAPLDLIKTHLITSHGMHGYFKTPTEIFFEIWNKDGWRGLFRGNGVNCIRVAPCKAIELCTFEIVKKILNRDGSFFQRVAAPVAGGAAGMAGTLATYPLELIRTRISLQPHKYHGAWDSIRKVINEEGFFALYAGLTPSLLGVFPYAATNYFVYDGLRSAYHRATGKRHVPTGLTLLFGAVAAAASSAVTYPLEVARRQMQLGSAALVVRTSTLDVVRHIYTEEGFLALYRGLGTTWLKLVPAAGISFVCYEAARRAWELEEQRIMQRKKK